MSVRPKNTTPAFCTSNDELLNNKCYAHCNRGNPLVNNRVQCCVVGRGGCT